VINVYYINICMKFWISFNIQMSTVSIRYELRAIVYCLLTIHTNGNNDF